MEFGQPLLQSEYSPVVISENKVSNGMSGDIPLHTNHLKHVGWSAASYTENNSNFFSEETIRIINRQINQILLNDPKEEFIISKQVIVDVMGAVEEDFVKNIGGIYTKEIMNSGHHQDTNLEMMNRVIETITSKIRTEHDMIKNNNSLSKWNTVLGDFNENNLRSHSKIKIREKNTSHRGVVSFMNY